MSPRKATMKTNPWFLHTLFITLAILMGLAKPDPAPLQDYCVANTKSPQSIYLNGAPCINPNQVIASQFTTSVLAKRGNTKANPFGFNVTLTNVVNLPGVNTMGLTMARVDIDGNGLVPPHSHPRASEVTICLQGILLVGFVDTTNRLYTQRLKPGDSFVFPKALIHFLYNLDAKTPALAISGLSSQNPGAQLASVAIFTSKPPIPNEVLKIAFQINSQDVARIRKNLGG